MTSELAVAGGGVAVGILFGLFGVGGSSFATPVLSLLGVPPLLAVASALPATIPSALSGSASYIRREEMDWRVAWLSIAGGLPATIAGALLSRVVGGQTLLVASGVVLGVVGLRVLRSITPKTVEDGARRRRKIGLVLTASAGVGLFTGLLANGGGFLLVPVYLILLGMPMRTSSGTSLAVVAALSVPTLVTHWALGNISWAVAVAFAVGAIPAAYAGGRLADHFDGNRLRVAFGCLLIVFATCFVIRQVLKG